LDRRPAVLRQLLAAWAARSDPQVFEVGRRHLRYPPYFRI
jgi:type IV secretory pathway TrbD component